MSDNDRPDNQVVDEFFTERDAAIKERDKLREEVKQLKLERECAVNDRAIQAETVLELLEKLKVSREALKIIDWNQQGLLSASLSEIARNARKQIGEQ